MKDTKIHSITEAFSMQPNTYKVCKQVHEDSLPWSNKDVPHEHKGYCIKEINLERVQIGYECGNPVEKLMYVGYGFNGQKKFQYQHSSVNVHYENE